MQSTLYNTPQPVDSRSGYWVLGKASVTSELTPNISHISPQKIEDDPMFGLALLACTRKGQLAFNFVIPSHSPDHFLQGTPDDGGNSQPSSFLNLADVLNVPPVQSDAHSLSDSIHLGSEVSSCGPSPQKASERYQNSVEAMSNFGQTQHQGAKENTALLDRVNTSLPLAVLDPLAAKYRPLIERVLARLSEAERREVNTHFAQDIRQSWICVSLASKDSTQPFVESSYACYGVHPSKVWERILAERHSRLGAEYHDWFDSNDCLRPDVPKFTPPPVKEVEPNERIEALMSAPSLPPSKGATGAGLGTAGPALQPNDKERKPA